ncbi:MAG: hypothetical protein TYPL_0400 [Candidatus Tyloplasma litorale]|nr:MAG: hypothetical protein TYPL_0400 [Mycoplasmatales bacterium]
MLDKWMQLEFFYKSIFISIFYSLIAIIISLSLLVVNESYIYGAIIGICMMYFSYFVIWILWYKINSIKTFMAKSTPLLVPFIRILLFLVVFLIIIFVINENDTYLSEFLVPINTLFMMFIYTIPMFAYLTIGFIEIILKKKKRGE